MARYAYRKQSAGETRVRLSNRISGGVLVALGAAAAWVGSRLPPVPGQDVGPAAFPMVIGLGLVACGALIALGIGHSFEVDEAPAPLNPRILLPPGLLLFYVVAAEPLGFLLTAAVMVLAVSMGLGARLRLALAMAVIAPPLVHLAFYKLLRVPLPAGLLAAPWA